MLLGKFIKWCYFEVCVKVIVDEVVDELGGGEVIFCCGFFGCVVVFLFFFGCS